MADLRIYTDSETAAQIAAAVVIYPRAFRSGNTLGASLSRSAEPLWKPMYSATREVGCVEILAKFADPYELYCVWLRLT